VGLEIVAAAPEVDIDGRALTSTPTLLLFLDQPRCDGRPAATALAGTPLRFATRETKVRSARVVAAIEDRQGEPSVAIELRWSPPPPAPERPIVFVDTAGAVQITWLPPAAARVRVLRDGIPIGEARADASVYADTPEAGTHRYALEGVGPGFRTAASQAVEVDVP